MGGTFKFLGRSPTGVQIPHLLLINKHRIMLVWILILTLLVALMFIVLVILGITILKHIEIVEEEVKEICCRTAFIQGMVEAISDMVRNE